MRAKVAFPGLQFAVLALNLRPIDGRYALMQRPPSISPQFGELMSQVLERHELAFDTNSLEFREYVKDRISQLIKGHAEELALRANRVTVTEDDMRQSTVKALKEFMRELATNRGDPGDAESGRTFEVHDK